MTKRLCISANTSSVLCDVSENVVPFASNPTSPRGLDTVQYIQSQGITIDTQGPRRLLKKGCDTAKYLTVIVVS